MDTTEFDEFENYQDKPYRSSFVYRWQVSHADKAIEQGSFVASPSFSDPSRDTWWHLRLYSNRRRRVKRMTSVRGTILKDKYLSLQLHLDSALPVLARFSVVANMFSGKMYCRSFFTNEFTFDVAKPYWVSTLFPLTDLLPGASLELNCKIQVLHHPDRRSPSIHNLGSLLKQYGRYDVVLAAGTKEVSAHRLILSAVSPELAKRLELNDKARLEIPDLPSDTLQTVVDFIYYGTFRPDLALFPTNKIQAMLVFALKYGISSLRYKLERYLASEPTLPPFHSVTRTAIIEAYKCDDSNSNSVTGMNKRTRVNY